MSEKIKYAKKFTLKEGFKLPITDNHSEMEKIGKQIFKENTHIYDERTLKIIKEKINEMMPTATKVEKESVFFRSIYDFWAYGNSIEEEFYYKFADKTHENKSEYLTNRILFKICNHLNDINEAINLIERKYNLYNYLKEYYHRDIVQISNDDDYDEFCNFVDKHPIFVSKLDNFSWGVSVERVDSSNYSNKKELFEFLLNKVQKSKKDLYFGHLTNDSNIVLEELIKQDEFFEQFNSSSVNSIRVTTVKVGDKVNIFYPWLKWGKKGSFTDNGCGISGGYVAGIDVEKGEIVTNGFDQHNHEIEYIPNSKIKIHGLKIPKWKDLINLVKVLARKFSKVNYIGWDVVLNDSIGGGGMDGYRSKFMGRCKRNAISIWDRKEARIL